MEQNECYSSNEIREKLKQRNLKQVSRSTGIIYSRLYSFMANPGKNIRHDDALVIIKYLAEN